MNKDQLYIPSTNVDNSSHNNVTSGGFDFEKYIPYVDAVKNLLIPSLEKSIYDGLEMFVYCQKDSLSSYYGFGKSLDVTTTLESSLSEICGNPDLENVGIIKGIIKPAVKHLIKNGLINHFINAVVLNNRLNKICRDLYVIRFGKDVPPYIDTWNLIDENNCYSGYNDVSKSLSHTSVETTTINSNVQNDAESNYSDDELEKNNDNDKKLEKNHSKILVDSSSSIYVISKAQDNIEPHNIKEGVSLKKKKIITDGSSEYLDVNLRKPNIKIDWDDKNSKIVNNESNNCQEVDKLLLPCNCENFLRTIIKTDSSSSDSHLVEQLNKLDNAMKNTCFSFKDILGQLDKKSTNKCHLFNKLREKYIEFKLKMKEHDGSMTNLFIDRVEIARINSQSLGKPSTSLEVDKSQRDDAETSSRFNFTFNEISNENIDDVNQEIIRNSNSDSFNADYFNNNKLITPPKIHDDIFSSTKIKDNFEIRDKKISKECNSENSCDCSTSTESSKIITKNSTNMFSNRKNNNINNNYNKATKIKNKIIIDNNKNKEESDESTKDFSSIRFKKNVEFYGNNSVSTQIINSNHSHNNNNKLMEEKISMMSQVDYDIFEKSKVFEILKTIFEENEGQICSYNVEKEEEKFIIETSVEQAIDRNKLRDDSSSFNHVVSPVGSSISLGSKITRVISVDKADVEVSDKYENNFDHFCDLDESELTKRTSTAERKKEIDNLLNREDFDIQELDQNKIRSYSSRNLSEILAEGKKNNLSDSSENKFECYDEYLNFMNEMENNKRNLTPQGVKEVENSSKKNSQTRNSNKSEIISYSGGNLFGNTTKNRRKHSSTSQRNKHGSYNEHFHVIGEIEEKNHNLDVENNKTEEILSGKKNIADENKTKLAYNREASGSIKKRLSEKDKPDHNCEYFYLLDEMEENNRTSTPERKRDVESLLKREDLTLQDGNENKTQSYFDKNIVEKLSEKKCPSILLQEKAHKTGDFVAYGLNENSKNSAAISQKSSSKKASKIPRSISQKDVNSKNVNFHADNKSLIDLGSICQCSSDSDTSKDENLMIPPSKDQSSRNKKNEKKSTNLPQRRFNIRALISALCRGLKNIFSRTTLRKLKHLLKRRIFNSTKKRKNIDKNSGFCVPKSCNNRIPNYNSINLNNKNENNNVITDKYCNGLSKTLKREKNILNFNQQPKAPKYKIEMISKDKQGSKYTCCRDQNNLREDWVNPKIVNSHQTFNVSLSSCDYDTTRKRLYHRKYMRRRPSEYLVLNNRKLKKSSSKESHSCCCCYYKNLAAKHLAEYLNFRLKHQEMSDTDDVHCKECLESTDSELKSMLNEYLKSSKYRKKKSMKKSFEK